MKKFFIAVGIIVLLIPIVLSVMLYRQVLKEESLRERLLSVDVVNPEERSYTYAPDAENGNQAEIFSFLESLKGQLDKSVKTEQELAEGKKFSLTYHTNHREYFASVYVLNPEPNLFFTYISNDKGEVYCLDSNATDTFISRPFAYPIYDASTLPVLKLSSGDIRACSATWNVKGPSADVLNVPFIADPQVPVILSDYTGGEVLSFSVVPDEVSVRITNGEGVEIFNGDGSLYPGFRITRSATITVEIRAVWNKKDTSAFYGSATYAFSASVVAPPEFHLNTNTAKPGEVLLLSCVNIPEDITLTAVCEPALPAITLNRVGNNVYAFLPLSYDAQAGDYRLTLSDGTETYTLSFAVEKKTFSKAATVPSRLISADAVLAATSEESLTGYREVLSVVGTMESAQELFFDGSFIDYQKKFNLYKGYGLYVPFESGNMTIRNDGVYFSAKTGSVMEAMGDGTVCYVGELAYIGKFVVIDHGYGLRTWYMTLGKTSVAVGDKLSKGATVGKTGETGLCPSATAWVMITVGETPVSPYAFWESELSFIK